MTVWCQRLHYGITRCSSSAWASGFRVLGPGSHFFFFVIPSYLYLKIPPAPESDLRQMCTPCQAQESCPPPAPGPEGGGGGAHPALSSPRRWLTSSRCQRQKKEWDGAQGSLPPWHGGGGFHGGGWLPTNSLFRLPPWAHCMVRITSREYTALEMLFWLLRYSFYNINRAILGLLQNFLWGCIYYFFGRETS